MTRFRPIRPFSGFIRIAKAAPQAPGYFRTTSSTNDMNTPIEQYGGKVRPVRTMAWRPWPLALLALCLGLLTGCTHEPVVPEEPEDGGIGGPGPGPEACDPGTVYFQQQVLPILISNCAVPGCHNEPTDENDDIQITSYETLMNSGVVQDGDLWEVINESDPDDRMPQPPQAPLTAEQIALIGQWIQQGAQNSSCESAVCDTLNVTYATTIVPIVQQRCQGCHSGGTPQGGLDFTQWSVLNTVAMDGRLEAAIQHLPSGVAMPPTGPMLPDCRIRQFLLWIDAGAPNN